MLRRSESVRKEEEFVALLTICVQYINSFRCLNTGKLLMMMVMTTMKTETIKLLLPARKVVGIGWKREVHKLISPQPFIYTTSRLCARIQSNHLKRHVFGIELKSAPNKPAACISSPLQNEVHLGKQILWMDPGIPTCY